MLIAAWKAYCCMESREEKSRSRTGVRYVNQNISLLGLELLAGLHAGVMIREVFHSILQVPYLRLRIFAQQSGNMGDIGE